MQGWRSLRRARRGDPRPPLPRSAIQLCRGHRCRRRSSQGQGEPREHSDHRHRPGERHPAAIFCRPLGRCDRCELGRGNDDLTNPLWSGRSVVRGGSGTDRIVGRQDGDYIDLRYRTWAPGTGLIRGFETVWGMGGDNEIAGRSADETLVGGRGNDAVLGNRSADQLFGSAGDDSLSGGRGPIPAAAGQVATPAPQSHSASTARSCRIDSHRGRPARIRAWRMGVADRRTAAPDGGRPRTARDRSPRLKSSTTWWPLVRRSIRPARRRRPGEDSARVSQVWTSIRSSACE